MDRNGDGVITRDEWRGNDNSFAVHDRNGDGVLSGDEARAGARGRVRNNVIISDDRFRRLDLNNDGLVSRDEFRNDALFGRLDVDRNNLLTRDEFFGRIDTRRVDSFASLDRNGDALIRPNEWHGSMRDFERLDRNRDGVITRDEFFYRSRY
jgi:Ca2+-binding EF-hand superfamily protein